MLRPICIALVLTAPSLEAHAAPIQVAPGTPIVSVADAEGTPRPGYRVAGTLALEVTGPTTLDIACYVKAPLSFKLTSQLGGAKAESHRVSAVPIKVKVPKHLGAVARLTLPVPAGPQHLTLSAPGCVLTVEAERERVTSIERTTTTTTYVLGQESGTVPAPPPSRAPAAALPPAVPAPAASPTPLVAVVPEAPRPAPAPPPAPTPAPIVIAQPAKPEASEAAPARVQRIRTSVRLGTIVPRTELGTGFAVAGDVAYALPVADNRVSVGLGVGYAMSPYQGPKIIPGRGYDPAFTQNTTLVPVSLEGRFTQRIGASGLALYGGLGVELLFVSASFQNFSATSSASDTTFGIVFEGGLEYPLGPGAVVADLRYSEARADLGPLGNTGQDQLGGALLTAGYALRF
ncbi:MAG: hypothetical protein JST54_06865 [Deltaproteobacteria bacterium]|nr:hypothetical protein [Deltaproteobacteria bacterium]